MLRLHPAHTSTARTRRRSCTGSLTGTLLAGHYYVFSYRSDVSMLYEASPIPSATAAGFVALSFIPEPSTALLVTLGLVGLAVKRRRVH